jgi:predicted permease
VANVAVAAAIARAWVRVYTLGMAAPVRRRRIAEVDSWFWEVRREAGGAGAGRRRIEERRFTTALRGLIDDLAWRREQTRHMRELTGATNQQRGTFMDKLLQDVGVALRTALRNPAFAVTAIFTLSLGIGANVAIFGLTNTMLLKSLPYPEGEKLVMLWETMPERGFDQLSLSPLNYVDWREQQTAFTDIAVYQNTSFALLSGGEPERFEGSRASAALFDVLGVEPTMGRVFGEAEDRPGGDRVVVVSDGLWRRRFGADPDLVGASVIIDGDPHTVIGVMPRDFNFPDDGQMWVPLALDVAQHERSNHNLGAIGRLRDGIGLEQAYVEMSGIAARLAEAYPDTNDGYGVFLQSFRESEIGDERILVYVLSGVVGFVLLIACANVANLTLARAGGRRREIAVRAALGAGRGRLMRQLLTESVMLSAVGGVFGLFIGAAGKNMIVAAFPEGVPTWMNWDFDATVYGFLVAVTLLTGMLFGFAPALHASRGNLGATLRSTGRAAGGRRRSWLRGGLVVGEVALATILLIGAGLMVRAYINVSTVDPGFDADDLQALWVALPESEYPEAVAQQRFFDELVERVRAVPGVEAAAATTLLPVGSFSGTYLGVEGNESTDTSTLPVVTYTKVTPGYFETLGIPLIEGRVFAENDGAEGTPEVLLVTQAAAERFWPGESPLGKRVKFGPISNAESAFKTVVGVVGDVMQTGIGDDLFPGVYIPVAQSPASSMALVVRAPGGPGAVLGAIREQLWQIDDDLPIFGVTTMRDRMANDDWEEKLFTRIFSTFAVIALVLAAVGLYGLVSYSVAQRTREIGVRIALGADRRDVVRMVVRQGMALTAIGLLLGLLGSWGVTRVIAGLLFGVSPTDPATFGGILFVLAAVAALASYLPARRAMRVDPVTALREQ